jgi:hypothetical protein
MESIEQLTAEIERASDAAVRGELFFRRGRLRWKHQDRSGAISDYGCAAELAPECGAREALSQAREIMDFFNKDMYNP